MPRAGFEPESVQDCQATTQTCVKIQVLIIPNYLTGTLTLHMKDMVKKFKALEPSNLKSIQFIDRQV